MLSVQKLTIFGELILYFLGQVLMCTWKYVHIVVPVLVHTCPRT